MSTFSYRWRVLPFMLMVLLPLEGRTRTPERGHGIVGMKGSIIDTPCAIQINDVDQVVKIEGSTTGQIVHDGRGVIRLFRIHLTDCVLKPQAPHAKNWSGFQVTFDGDASNGLFKAEGVSGIGIQITDHDGQIARPGVPLPGIPLTTEAQVLEYSLRVIGTPDHLHAGSFQSTIRFKVDYF